MAEGVSEEQLNHRILSVAKEAARINAELQDVECEYCGGEGAKVYLYIAEGRVSMVFNGCCPDSVREASGKSSGISVAEAFRRAREPKG